MLDKSSGRMNTHVNATSGRLDGGSRGPGFLHQRLRSWGRLGAEFPHGHSLRTGHASISTFPVAP